jgi:predicted secreted Zn-dependent protease
MEYKMKKVFYGVLALLLLATTTSIAQSKMIVGKQYSAFVDIPKQWTLSKHPELPFFIKPTKANVSEKTYIYVYGIDYNTKVDLKKWLTENTKVVQQQFKGTKVLPVKKTFSNIKANDNCTGKYELVQYKYANGKCEALLAIECKQSTVTVLLSAATELEFKQLLVPYYELCASLKVLAPMGVN